MGIGTGVLDTRVQEMTDLSQEIHDVHPGHVVVVRKWQQERDLADRPCGRFRPKVSSIVVAKVSLC